jgi:hypothetical protein
LRMHDRRPEWKGCAVAGGVVVQDVAACARRGTAQA